MRGAVVAVIALWSAGAAGASTVLLPSPTRPLDPPPPLVGAAPGAIQLPRPATASNDQEVLVDVTPSGAVTDVRVRQRLTLAGFGDYFFQIGAPVHDVRALPESRSQPGLRRDAVVWQGFSPGNRVLAAELALVPGAAARALPLQVERTEGSITLRNTTSAVALGFVAPVRRSSLRPILSGIADQAAGRRPQAPPAVEILGPTSARRLRVDAPLRVRGTVERDGRVLGRIRLVLGGARPREATIEAPADADLRLVAEPIPLVADLTHPTRAATGEELLLRAQRALLRLARVNQYRSFLASPAPGRADAVYRYRTVAATAETPSPQSGDGENALLFLALGLGGIVALGAALVAWAHL